MRSTVLGKHAYIYIYVHLYICVCVGSLRALLKSKQYHHASQEVSPVRSWGLCTAGAWHPRSSNSLTVPCRSCALKEAKNHSSEIRGPQHSWSVQISHWYGLWAEKSFMAWCWRPSLTMVLKTGPSGIARSAKNFSPWKLAQKRYN